jgi:hypothetical protein
VASRSGLFAPGGGLLAWGRRAFRQLAAQEVSMTGHQIRLGAATVVLAGAVVLAAGLPAQAQARPQVPAHTEIVTTYYSTADRTGDPVGESWFGVCAPAGSLGTETPYYYDSDYTC